MTKSRAARLLVFASFALPSGGCISSLPLPKGDGGTDASMPTHGNDGAVCSRGGSTGAVGIIGCPCSSPGALACNGNDSKEELVCSKDVWQGNGGCATDERCATSGPNAGTCMKIADVCADASPGAKMCAPLVECPEAGIADAAVSEGGSPCSSTEAVFQCGPDRITADAASCGVFGCKDGKCTQSCTPGASACTGGTVNVCGSPGNTFTDITCPGECVSNRCLVSWSSDTAAVGIVADDADVFWVDGRPGFGSTNQTASVWRAALGGAAAVSLYTAASSGAFVSVALDPSNVYFVEEDPVDGGERYSILQMARAGGSAVTLATPATVPIGLGTDSQYVYWAESPGTVMRAPTGTPGSAAAVAMGQEIEAMVVDPATSSIYWIDTGSPMSAIVQAAPLAGMPVTLATADDPESIAVYAGTVYWTTSDETGASETGSVYSWSAGGGVATVATGMDLPFDSPGITANATAVAWITREALVSMPTAAGGKVRRVNADRPTAIALGTTFLVWSDSTQWTSRDNGIFGVAPP